MSESENRLGLLGRSNDVTSEATSTGEVRDRNSDRRRRRARVQCGRRGGNKRRAASGARRASETPKNKAARLSAQVSSLEPRQTTRIIITAKSTFHEG